MEKFCKRCGSEFNLKHPAERFCFACRAKRAHEMKRIRDARYKDKKRHGGKRARLIEKNGLICNRCSKVGTRYDIHTHHINHDKDHEYQEMLCRSCHAKAHGFGDEARLRAILLDSIPRETVEDALRGKRIKDAHKVLGISRSALFKIRKKYGFKKIKPNKVYITKEQLGSLAHLTQAKQAEILGVSSGSITRHRKIHGLSRINKPKIV